MAESADDLYARVMAAADAQGRLPHPSVLEWETFPWEVADGRIAAKPLAPPVPEEPRLGEGGVDCFLCAADLPGVIWTNDRWRVKHLPERGGLPLVLMLEPVAHLDLPDLDEDMAAEYGLLAVRTARAVEALPHVARCHLHRFGDGAAHLHVWFMARTEGLPSLRGSYAIDWNDVLPPGPEDVWRADLATVAASLAAHDGRATVRA
jgi:hypothetical protein